VLTANSADDRLGLVSVLCFLYSTRVGLCFSIADGKVRKTQPGPSLAEGQEALAKYLDTAATDVLMFSNSKSAS